MTGRLAQFSARQRALLALAAGAASALALPPVHAVPVLLLSLPLLLALIGLCRSATGAAATGFWFGFGLNLLGLYWITDAILFEADRFWWLVPLAVPAVSVVMAAFIAVPCAVAWVAAPGWRRAACLAGGWVLADLARQFIGTGFPWNPLGSVWALPGWLGDVLIQPASVVGVHGLTLFTLLLAATPVLGRRAMIAGAASLTLWVGFGVGRLAQKPRVGPPVTLVIVQGNVEQGHKWDQATANETFAHYLALTAQGVLQARALGQPGAIVAIWPETASPFLLDQDFNARAAIAEAGVTVLAGAVRFGADGRPRNSLLALDSTGTVIATYDKFHLVPFGEYQPGWLPFLHLFPGGGFAFGPGPRTLSPPGVPPVGALICYEAIFPAQVVQPGARPDWLVNVTNDAWFGNSSGPRQHLAAARLRAVEEGLPLARAANTGISALFDPRGHELGRLGMQRAGTLVLKLPPPGAETVAARGGLWIPALLAGVALGAAFIRRRVHR